MLLFFCPLLIYRRQEGCQKQLPTERRRAVARRNPLSLRSASTVRDNVFRKSDLTSQMETWTAPAAVKNQVPVLLRLMV